MELARLVGLVIGFTLLSGFGDTQGFIGASRMWAGDSLDRFELARSAAGFGVGAVGYWLAVRYLRELGVNAAEVQTLFWFVVTIIGVGVLSRTFTHWPLADQVVGVGVLAGVGWLLVRAGG